MMRQAQGSRNQATAFGKKPRPPVFQQPSDRDVQPRGWRRRGKEELAEVVELLKYPDKFLRHLAPEYSRRDPAARPPGTGKTLLSRAVAGEAGKRRSSIFSGSEFVESSSA